MLELPWRSRLERCRRTSVGTRRTSRGSPAARRLPASCLVYRIPTCACRHPMITPGSRIQELWTRSQVHLGGMTASEPPAWRGSGCGGCFGARALQRKSSSPPQRGIVRCDADRSPMFVDDMAPFRRICARPCWLSKSRADLGRIGSEPQTPALSRGGRAGDVERRHAPSRLRARLPVAEVLAGHRRPRCPTSSVEHLRDTAKLGRPPPHGCPNDYHDPRSGGCGVGRPDLRSGARVLALPTQADFDLPGDGHSEGDVVVDATAGARVGVGVGGGGRTCEWYVASS